MKRASRKSVNSSIGHFGRNAKLHCAAMAVASAIGTFALTSAPASAATVTWAGTISDPNSANYDLTPQGTAAGFVEDQNLYLWNTSVANWTGAPTYTVGDNVVFTDNFAGGTDIRLTSGSLNPSSITFKHIAGAAETVYRFTNSTSTLGNADFYSDASHTENLSANSPFGNGANTTLTLDTGFLGRVVLRHRSNGSVLTGNTIIRSGILELGDSLPLPHNNNQNQPPVTLDGGELRLNVNSNANTNPASSNLTNTLSVLSNSTLSNGAINDGRVWNGPVSMANGVTLTLKSIQGFRLKLSNMNLNNTAGTIRLEDVGANTTVVALESGSLQDAPNAVIDLGTGLSEIVANTGTTADPETFVFGTLIGGANTKLSGGSNVSTVSTYQIGTRNENSTFAGIIRDNQVEPTGLAALSKVGTATLTLTGNNTFTGPTTVSGGTLLLSGGGRLSGSNVTIDSGATLSIDNTTNNHNRLIPAALTFNQGTLVFQGNRTVSTAEGVGALNIVGGGNVVQTTATGAAGTAQISFTTLTRTAGVVDFKPDPNVNIRITTTTPVNGILGGFATTNGNDWAAMSGLFVSAYSAYTTDTAPGTWAATQNINLTTGGTSTVAASATVNSLRFAGIGTTVSIAAGQTLNIGTGGVLPTGTGGATISGAGSLTAGSVAGAELIVTVPSASNTLTVSAPITDNGVGAVTLVKAGPGKLFLSGAGSTYSGGTQLIGGTLQVGVANFFPVGSDLVVNYGTAFDVGGFNQTFGNVRVIDGSLLNSAGAASISASTAFDMRKGTVNTPLTGAAALSKTTIGTVTLNAVNSYTGGTTVTDDGTLVLGAAGAVPAGGNVTVGDGGTLNIGAFNQSVGTLSVGTLNDDLDITGGNVTGTTGVITATSAYDMRDGTISAILAGSVGLNKSAENSNVTLTRLNTYTGPTTIGTGNVGITPTLFINSIANGGSASAIGASSNAASNLVIGSLSVLNYNGTGHSTNRLFTLGGAGTITSSGTGPLNFTNSGAVVSGGGVLTLNGTNTGANTFAPLLDTSVSGLFKGGQGVWIITNDNTYTGATSITSFGTGALQISSIQNGGVPSPIGASSNSVDNLLLNGGALRYVGTGHSTDRLFRLGGSASIESSGSGPLNFTNTGAMGSLETEQTLTLGGTNTGANSLALAIGDNDSINKEGAGTWTLSGALTYTGNTTVAAGKLRLTSNVTTTTEVHVDGGTLEAVGSGSTSRLIKTENVDVNSGASGRLDLNQGSLILTDQDVDDVRDMLVDGSGGVGFAAQTWDQPGIMSTSAAADPLTYAVGYMDNDNFILGPKSDFEGEPVPAGSILVKSTLSGDADLDWDVDDDDVTVLGIFYGGPGHWYEADFDYTGVVDDDDVTIMGITYGQSLPGAPGGVSAVPEPASLGLLGLAATSLMRRRRARSAR